MGGNRKCGVETGSDVIKLTKFSLYSTYMEVGSKNILGVACMRIRYRHTRAYTVSSFIVALCMDVHL